MSKKYTPADMKRLRQSLKTLSSMSKLIGKSWKSLKFITRNVGKG